MHYHVIHVYESTLIGKNKFDTIIYTQSQDAVTHKRMEKNLNKI